jgi:segregation and condensation protein A
MTPDENNRLEEASQLDLYRIELESFQGPLDLLLHLIKKNELDIYDIPVAEISEQYLSYLEVMRELNLDVASEFLVMASTLIHLKSRMLLPPEEEEEEEEGEDPREELVRRLLEYQKYKKAAEELGSRPALGRDVFARPEDEVKSPGEDTYIEATMFQLMDALQRVITEAEKRKPHEITRDAYSIEEGIGHIETLLAEKGSIRFGDLFTGQESRRQIVTIFLGVLDLIKRGRISAVQEDQHAPLRIIPIPDSGSAVNPEAEGGQVSREENTDDGG